MEDNAALIAGHLEAAGELPAAYGWHMRAATWATNRDIAAARLSWERARKIADALPDDDPDRAGMRIAPRTMLCGTAWRVQANVAGAGFEELRQLCTAAGDKASLAIGMAELVIDHAYHDRIWEAAELANEVMALTESIGDPNLTVGLSVPVLYAKRRAPSIQTCCGGQRVIDLADGDPQKATSYRVAVGVHLCIAGHRPVRPGSSRLARRHAARRGHGPQRRPACPMPRPSPSATSGVYRMACWTRRFRRARDRGGPVDCRTIRR